MLYEFHGLPVHVLIVHLAVVAAPLSAVMAIAYLIPAWQRWLRWPLLILTFVAAAAILLARQSGENLKTVIAKQLQGTAVGSAVEKHEHYAGQLTIAMLTFAAAVVVMIALSFSARSSLMSGTMAVLVALLAVVVLWLVYQTGEAGAKASWNPSGSINYSAPSS